MSDHPHSENWRRWIGHLAGTPAHGLEVGSFKGESAEWMLRNIFSHPGATYTCVDNFRGSAEHHLGGIDCTGIERECRQRLAKFPQAQVVVGESCRELRILWPFHRLDFVYVDGSHDARNVLRDSVLAFDLLKVGGVMVWDDLAWHVMSDPIDCPRMAIESFVACYARQLEVIGKGSQLAARKAQS